MNQVWIIATQVMMYVNPPATMTLEAGRILCINEDKFEQYESSMRKLTKSEIKIITGSKQVRGSMIKPEWLDGAVVETDGEDADDQVVSKPVNHGSVDLKSMNKKQLMEYANENGIGGLKQSMSIADIIKAIKAK